MARWLFKQEPSEYSYDDLVRDGQTVWDGVSNPLALKHLQAVNVGDEVLLYHTGQEKAIVGVMQVISTAPVTVKPVRRLAKPVPLAAIKADDAFANWELVRISRLSVMPVPAKIWSKIIALAQ